MAGKEDLCQNAGWNRPDGSRSFWSLSACCRFLQACFKGNDNTQAFGEVCAYMGTSALLCCTSYWCHIHSSGWIKFSGQPSSRPSLRTLCFDILNPYGLTCRLFSRRYIFNYSYRQACCAVYKLRDTSYTFSNTPCSSCAEPFSQWYSCCPVKLLVYLYRPN